MTTRFITVTYEVTLEVDENTSMNHAEDAVSLQLWHIGDDRDDLAAVAARLIESIEHLEGVAE